MVCECKYPGGYWNTRFTGLSKDGAWPVLRDVGGEYVPAALVDTLVDALIACRDNYGKYGGLVNDPNAPGALIDKIQNALEEAGVTE